MFIHVPFQILNWAAFHQSLRYFVLLVPFFACVSWREDAVGKRSEELGSDARGRGRRPGGVLGIGSIRAACQRNTVDGCCFVLPSKSG